MSIQHPITVEQIEKKFAYSRPEMTEQLQESRYYSEEYADKIKQAYKDYLSSKGIYFFPIYEKMNYWQTVVNKYFRKEKNKQNLELLYTLFANDKFWSDIMFGAGSKISGTFFSYRDDFGSFCRFYFGKDYENSKVGTVEFWRDILSSFQYHHSSIVPLYYAQTDKHIVRLIAQQYVGIERYTTNNYWMQKSTIQYIKHLYKKQPLLQVYALLWGIINMRHRFVSTYDMMGKEYPSKSDIKNWIEEKYLQNMPLCTAYCKALFSSLVYMMIFGNKIDAIKTEIYRNNQVINSRSGTNSSTVAYYVQEVEKYQQKQKKLTIQQDMLYYIAKTSIPIVEQQLEQQGVL